MNRAKQNKITDIEENSSEGLRIPLERTKPIKQQYLDTLVQADKAYAHWLRVVLLRLLIKTPALTTLKERSFTYHLISVCDFLGFENLDDFIQDRTLNEIRTELQNTLAEWESELTSDCHFPEELEKNLHSLADTVGLNRIETNILGLTVLIHTENILQEGVALLGDELNGFNVNRIISHLLDADPEVVRVCLESSQKLAQSDLLTVDINRKMGLQNLLDLFTSTFPSRMLMPQTDIRSVLEGFARPIGTSELLPADYEHIKENMDICLRLIKNAQENNQIGINILIYGEPGVGKTEFCRLLASQLNCQLLEINSNNKAGEPVSGIRRIKSHRLIQPFFAKTPTIILFDECEDVLDSKDSFLETEEVNVLEKPYINKTLQINSVPTIWIANSTQKFNKAFFRRFSLCFHMPMPPKAQREKMVSSLFKDIISNEARTVLMEQATMSPSLLKRTAEIITSVGTDLSISERDDLAIHIINNQLKAEGKPQIQKKKASHNFNYQLNWINTDINLQQLSDSLVEQPSGRLCIYGPPGTGKTAFGKWLAEKLKIPHMVMKGSDIFSKWSGETEKNIAEAFKRAQERQALLQFDEVDSFLQNRQYATKQWEVAPINEMLTQMENFEGIFIASTNLFNNLDEASLRRFDFSMKFDFMTPESAWEMFKTTCNQFDIDEQVNVFKRKILFIRNLTPGDFQQIHRRSRLLPPKSANDIFNALENAISLKKSKNSNPIGFHI